MKRALPLLLLGAVVSTASCQKEQGEDTETPVETPKVGPEKATLPNVAISSVNLQEDCPDPAPPAAAGAAIQEAKSAVQEREAPQGDMAEGDSDRYSRPPCSQSTMQISINGQGDSSFQFSLGEVRVLNGEGEKIGVVKSRLPTLWKAEGYASWNEMVAPNVDVKASYKLSLPTWDDPNRPAGNTQYGVTFMVEADVTIDGIGKTVRSKTVRSNPVVPEPADMVET